MKITIDKIEFQTSADYDAGLLEAAKDIDPATYLAARIHDLLGSYAGQVIGTKAEAVKRAYLEAEPADRAAIEAAVPVELNLSESKIVSEQ